MNAFDFVVIAVVAAGAIYGLRQGLLRMVTSAVALLGAIYVASVYYTHAGAIAQHQFGVSATAGAIIGYLVVFIIIFSAIELIGTTAVRLTHAIHLSWADRFVGGLLGAGVVSIALGLAVMLIAAVLPPGAAILRDSRLAPMLVQYNEMLVRYIPEQAKEAYENNRDTLIRYWIAEAEKTMTHADSVPAASPSTAK